MADSTESTNWLQTIFNWLGYGTYNVTPPTLTDQQISSLQVDANGNLRVVDVFSKPGRQGAAITPNDGTTFSTPYRALWIGGGGNLTVILADDTVPVELQGVPAGIILPIQAKVVKDTGTTCTLIVGIL